MNRLHLIGVFVAVADANSFASAARKLGISPPAVTRAIKELENHLGLRLLTRSTRVLRVTDAGAQYAEDCRLILTQLTEADESVSGILSVPRGRLVITAPALFGARFVIPIVTEYLQRYPEINASCWFLDRVVNLMEEGVDVGARIGELPDSSMQAIRVGQVCRVICAAPSYLDRHGLPLTPSDLQAHAIVSASGLTPACEWRLMENGKPRLVKLHPRLTTTTSDAALSAALGGFGLTRLLSYQVAEHLREGRLKTVLSKFEPPALPVHVVHREEPYGSKRALAFIELAVERLRASSALN